MVGSIFFAGIFIDDTEIIFTVVYYCVEYTVVKVIIGIIVLLNFLNILDDLAVPV